jgi:hypothetical protein
VRSVWWERERHVFVEAVETVAGDAFERGRSAGRLLSLEEAVEDARGED